MNETSAEPSPPPGDGPISEFHRPIDPLALPGKGRTHILEAREDERKALAIRLGVLDILSLTAKVKATPMGGTPLIRVEGHFDASLRQTCSITLVPIETRVSEDFVLTYGPPGQEEESVPGGKEIQLHMEESDPPEPITAGRIDLGEAVAEHLSLAIDPFPRAPGARFEPSADLNVDANEPERTNPFAVLADLKKK
ncbi:YceD family protein [Rhodospirillum sp. A1_3_36]|uniref:YceD family protein n=1 Tax=Rhodospirillum sp. A1_3_36 TaxID=3391666 RepID=UPI0039A600E5